MKAYVKCERMFYGNDGLMYHLNFKIGLIWFTLAIPEKEILQFIGRFFENGSIEVSVFEFSGRFITTPDDKTILTPEMIGLRKSNPKQNSSLLV